MTTNDSGVKQLNIAIMGLGVVGSGLVRLLNANKQEILDKHNANINIVKVLERNVDKFRELELDNSLQAQSVEEICDDSSIDVVVELIGRIDPAKEFITKALKSGKTVVTANKDLICLYGQKLEKIAKANNVQLLYEASCLGAIPVISTLQNNFLGDKITSIKGIFNGTTNYILTKMTNEGMTYETALSKAQELGFAESNPTNDVDAIDSAYKLCILSRLAFGADVKFDDIARKGIRSITDVDIKAAANFNYCIKLLAIANYNDGSMELRCSPMLVSNLHHLSQINNSLNAITITGSFSRDVTLVGRGAGSRPTASAVVNDICNCLYPQRVASGRAVKSVEIDVNPTSKYYLRLTVVDKAGVIAKVSKCLGDNYISIESLIQQSCEQANEYKTLIIITHETTERSLDKAIKEAKLTKTIHKVENILEVMED